MSKTILILDDVIDDTTYIDELYDIENLKSATAIMYVKKNGFYVQGHFPGQPVMFPHKEDRIDSPLLY